MNWRVYMLPDRGFPMFMNEFPSRELAVDYYQRLCDNYPSDTIVLVRGLVVSYRSKEV